MPRVGLHKEAGEQAAAAANETPLKSERATADMPEPPSVPSGWERRYCPVQKAAFYLNAALCTSQWDHPVAGVSEWLPHSQPLLSHLLSGNTVMLSSSHLKMLAKRRRSTGKAGDAPVKHRRSAGEALAKRRRSAGEARAKRGAPVKRRRSAKKVPAKPVDHRRSAGGAGKACGAPAKRRRGRQSTGEAGGIDQPTMQVNRAT